MPANANDLASSLSIEEAAAMLHVSRRTLTRMLQEEQLEHVRIGTGRGQPRITMRAINDYLARRTVRADQTA